MYRWNTANSFNNWGYIWQCPSFGYKQFDSIPSFNYNVPIYTSSITPYSYNGYSNVSNSDSFTPTNSVSKINNVQSQTITQPLNAVNKKTKEKNGMPKWAKWTLSTLVITGICALAYFGLKNKGINKTVENLTNKVEFKPASTIDDAKNFAKKNFGVEYHNIDDVQAINYCNEWLTGTHNSCKTITKSSYPKIITNIDEGLASMFSKSLVKNGVEYEVMGINMKAYNNPIGAIDEVMNSGNVIKKMSNGKYVIVDEAYKTDFVNNFVNKLNSFDSTKANFGEKAELLNEFRSIQQGHFVNGKIVTVDFGKYHVFDHELGHMRHRHNYVEFDSLLKPAEYLKQNKAISKLSKEFVEDKGIQATARKVSLYATESPAEFVAEVYGLLKAGKTLPDDVMALYNKYGGPALA